MNNRFAFLFCVTAFAIALAGAAHGQTPTLTITKPTVTTIEPIRIIRNPPSLQLQSGTLTNRVLSNAALTDLLSQPNIGKIVGKLPAGPPGKHALLVILENGGVMRNIDPALTNALKVNIRTATCGNWEFELKAGESLPSLVQRVASQLAGNLNCLNPGNWLINTFNPYNWLDEQTDRALENAVKANNSLLNTQTRYDQVIVMEDANAVPSNVISVIRQFAPTHVLDIHVLTHGGAEFFSGYNGANFTNSSFFNVLKADRTAGKPLYIRAVYQMNCVSGTLKDNWTGLGAMVVNGTQSTNLNNMPHQYFHFLQRWLAVTGMSAASQKSFDDAAAYTRPVYVLVGMGSKVDVSRLTTSGSNVNATVSTSL